MRLGVWVCMLSCGEHGARPAVMQPPMLPTCLHCTILQLLQCMHAIFWPKRLIYLVHFLWEG